MRAKTLKLSIFSSFEDFYTQAPEELKRYIDRCAQTPQSVKWHPEGDAKKHIRIVFNRAADLSNIDLMTAAFFHDLGKADVTRKNPSNPDSWPAHGHELVSTRLVEKHRDWIEKIGANFELVHYLVKEHMRAKQIDKMRPVKRNEVISHPYYRYMVLFNDCDDMRTLTSDEID